MGVAAGARRRLDRNATGRCRGGLFIAVLLVSVACAGDDPPTTDPSDPVPSPAADEATGGAATDAPTDTAAPPDESAYDLEQDLHEALSFAPLESTFMGYTHWGRIAEYEGIDPSRSEAPGELSHAVLARNAAPSDTLKTNVHAISDAYGINQADLVWEAAYNVGYLYGTVFKLREAVDITDLVASFERSGFDRDEDAEVVELTQAHDVGLPGHVEGLNEVTILREKRVMIFGSERAAIVAAHEANEVLDEIPLAAGVVEAAGAVAGAEVFFTGCTATGPDDTSGQPTYRSHRRETQRQLRLVGGVRPFIGSLFGFDRERGEARGHLVLIYETPQEASQDVDARAALARRGRLSDKPYSEVFTLADATADGPYLTLTVDIVEDRPDAFVRLGVSGEPFALAAC